MQTNRSEVVRELRNFYRNRRVFVTGGQGFKGALLIMLLEEFGANVTNVGLQREDNLLFSLLSPNIRAQSHSIDVRDHDKLVKLMEAVAPDVVFHLAAQPIVSVGYVDPHFTFSTNFMGTVNVLDAIRLAPQKISAVLVTTDKSYFNAENVNGYREDDLLLGHDPYSGSKSAAEHAIYSFSRSYFDETLHGACAKIVSPCRAGNVIGGGDFSRDRLVPDLARAMKSKAGVHVRNFTAIRPYEHVLDALFAYVLLAARQAEDPKLAGPYNVGPNDESLMTNGEVIDFFVRRGLVTVIDEAPREGFHETQTLKLDSSKFRDAFGWAPQWESKEKILHNTYAWYEQWVSGADMADYTKQQIREFLK